MCYLGRCYGVADGWGLSAWNGTISVMMKLWQKFWAWYEKHYLLNVGIAAGLFALQLVHLYWLSADVVATRLVGQSFFELHGLFESLIILVDYTEIPAILSTSLVYINEFRQGRKWRGLLYLFFINSQFLHIFWITDEFVVEQFTGQPGVALPAWLAWVAIGIDYLELPVIVDTIKKLVQGIKSQNLAEIKEAFDDD